MTTIPKFIEEQLPRIKNLCEQHNLAELRLFGSMVENRFTDNSDIDFLYEFPIEAYDMGNYRKKVIDFNNDIESLFNRKVDLIPLNGLKGSFKTRILGKSIFLYGEESQKSK